MIKLFMPRFSSGFNDTLGLMYDAKFMNLPLAFTLEDEFRKKKVKGETRIPAGTYEIRYRKILSPMTKRYRNKFPWFAWHLQLQNVPNFKFIYIHPLNREDQTDGCIGVGSICHLNRDEDGFIGNSVNTFEKLYRWISAELDKGEKVTIEIRDSIQ